ncbi:MAG: DUF6285 domain-containing protein [Chloroflexota bacterium]|nr:DUF6285 domain-containing protein [Chloroflexota bacterium]
MQDKPTAPELILAVRDFLRQELAPALGDHRQRFRTLIAANVLDVVARELDGEEGRLRAQWERLVALDHSPVACPEILDLLRADIDRRERTLCERVRDGDADAGPARQDIRAYTRWAVEEKLRVSNPYYLERVTDEQE